MLREMCRFCVGTMIFLSVGQALAQWSEVEKVCKEMSYSRNAIRDVIRRGAICGEHD